MGGKADFREDRTWPPDPPAKKVAGAGRRPSAWPRQRRQQPWAGLLGSSPPERTRRTLSVPLVPESSSVGFSAAGLPSLEMAAGSSQRMPAASSGRQSSTVRDPRYSTAAWQKLRKAVLARDGYVCQIGGLRCRGEATSVHHLIPSSQAPELFWEPTNLVAACGRCNYGDGARVAAENTRRTIESLRVLVWEQQAQIDHLTERLARYETVNRAKPGRTPAIH
jgi:5-methylcytosine-specific restriction enzyme A